MSVDNYSQQNAAQNVSVAIATKKVIFCYSMLAFIGGAKQLQSRYFAMQSWKKSIHGKYVKKIKI